MIEFEDLPEEDMAERAANPDVAYRYVHHLIRNSNSGIIDNNTIGTHCIPTIDTLGGE